MKNAWAVGCALLCLGMFSMGCSSDDDKDIMNDSPASEAQALGLIQQYESQYLSFELAPLAKAGEL